MKCEEAREQLPTVGDEGAAGGALGRHLTRCESCRVEAGRYTVLRTSLAALESTSMVPPADLLPELMAIPAYARRGLSAHLARNRTIYASGAAAGVALVGAAGAVLWRSHRRAVATA